MTKEITKAFILQEIQDKFRLRDLKPAKFEFSETVIPVYDVAQHLIKRSISRMNIAITELGAMTILTVPDNMRYTIFGYTVVFVSGDYTVAGCYIERGDPTLFVYLDLTAARAVSYTVDLPKPVILESGHKMRINIDGYTSSGTMYVYTDRVKEEIR